jgi:hypothetical protein
VHAGKREAQNPAESALAAALRRTAIYEQLFRPVQNYATKQLELRVGDAKAQPIELCKLLWDDATDKETSSASIGPDSRTCPANSHSWTTLVTKASFSYTSSLSATALEPP